ncbi:MAG: PIN domain-containing protein [Planctomycetes bacterium]|nr:PIN domain-containing protein [Planctomycetota bacterium]
MTIAFDTQVFIWGIRRDATQGKDLVDQALALLRRVENSAEAGIFPAPVVTEGLQPIEEQGQQELLAEIMAMGLRVPPLDLSSAPLAASISRASHMSKEERDEIGVGRQCMKVDAMIVAIAKRAGARFIVSHDAGLQRAAEVVGLETLTVPEALERLATEQASQGDLFSGLDDNNDEDDEDLSAGV